MPIFNNFIFTYNFIDEKNLPLSKQEAHGSYRSQQFLITFYFVVYAISILNFEPLSEAPVLVHGL